MKTLFLVGACIATMILGCAAQNTQPKPQQYTAHNIWIHRGDLYCINFKLGSNFIPAGTAVKNVEAFQEDWPYISFKIAHTNERITVRFNERWHPRQTVRSYAKKMFTPKDFEQLTEGLNHKEIDSIKKGVVTVGMSKRAVLVSYGTPPEHYTRSVQNNEWYYWVNRARKKKICFDDNERATHCGQTQSGSL